MLEVYDLMTSVELPQGIYPGLHMPILSLEAGPFGIQLYVIRILFYLLLFRVPWPLVSPEGHHTWLETKENVPYFSARDWVLNKINEIEACAIVDAKSRHECASPTPPKAISRHSTVWYRPPGEGEFNTEDGGRTTADDSTEF